MEMIAKLSWIAPWILCACLTTSAQGLGGSMPGGQGAQHQRPSPQQMAAQLLTRFDANKDGELSLDELTQALQTLRAHRQHGAGGGHGCASSNAVSSASSGAAQSNQGVKRPQHTPPPAGKVAAELIAKFSSDGKGLTLADLEMAIAAHQAKRAAHTGARPQGGGQHGGSQTTGSDAGIF